MSSNPAATPLSYALPETQYGMIFERLEDGGVRITIPGTFGSELRARTAGSSHPLVTLAILIICSFNAIRKLPVPHRAIIELTRETFSIADRLSSVQPQAWPRAEIAELRPNRYGKGLYVRIPRQQNF